VQHGRRSGTIAEVAAEREVVRADPAMRRTALVLGGGVVAALVAAVVTAPGFLGSLSTLSQASPAEAVLWLAARLYRSGVLMYGQSPSPRTLWRALRAR